jgi:anti-sigma regulatory factor (Ser/Thr protein kinase)
MAVDMVTTGIPTQRGRDITLRLNPQPGAALAARAATVKQLERWGLGKQIDDAVTIVNELIGNVIKHAAKQGVLLFSAYRSQDGRFVIYVEDGNPELPKYQNPRSMDEHGRGLHIVEALASELHWATVSEDRKAVWAIL